MDVRGALNKYIIVFLLSIGLNTQAQLPLPVDTDNSLETELQRETVLKSEPLTITPALRDWQHHGLGTMTYANDGKLCLRLPVNTGKRAQGSPDDPDYATYGRATVSYHLHHRNLEDYHRITMAVFPRCEGIAIMNLNLFLNNEEGGVLGAHLVNLKNNQWNKVVYDISGLQRDNVRSIDIYTDLKGRNQAHCDSFTYFIKNIFS